METRFHLLGEGDFFQTDTVKAEITAETPGFLEVGQVASLFVCQSVIKDEHGVALNHLPCLVLECLWGFFGIQGVWWRVERFERGFKEIGVVLWLICGSRQELELAHETRCEWLLIVDGTVAATEVFFVDADGAIWDGSWGCGAAVQVIFIAHLAYASFRG